MPCIYTRKEGVTPKKSINAGDLLATISAVLGGASLKGTAKSHNINVMTLKRYLRKQKAQESDISNESNYKPFQIFYDKEENLLCEYLKTSSKLHHGLTPVQLRKLVFQYAMNIDKKVPESWKSEKCAVYDWYIGFMDRNKTLAPRTPEATSLNRAISFNKHNVDIFFSNLQKVYTEEKLVPQCVWNIDETGFNTVHKPPKNISYKR